MPLAELRNETAFNRVLRESIRRSGVQCMHIREADYPGVLDLLVYTGPEILAWVELKIEDSDLEVGQVEFIGKHGVYGTYVFRWRKKLGKIQVHKGLSEKVMATVSLHEERWLELFMRWNGGIR